MHPNLLQPKTCVVFLTRNPKRLVMHQLQKVLSLKRSERALKQEGANKFDPSWKRSEISVI